jgi:hypothetical protein
MKIPHRVSSDLASRLVLALLCAAALACGSFAQSSESSSDSSNNSSESSSNSSTSSSPGHDHDDEKTSSFEGDVEQYTAAFLSAGGMEQESFFAGLGDLARQHGVSDWEADPSTWEAIGRGLAHSDASAAERTAYQAAWTGGDAAKQTAVAKGISTVQ